MYPCVGDYRGSRAVARAGLLSRRRLLAGISAALLVFLVVVPAVVAYASLHPARCKPAGTPAAYGLHYENFTVTTGDGVRLRGWIIPGSPRVVFVVMHGYTSCRADRRLLEIQAELARRGYTVVAFDFRGHGESGGTTTIGPRESAYDVPAVLSMVRRRYPGARIVLLGYSMGAVAAIMAGSRASGDIVIVADSPYPTLDEVIPRWLKSYMGIPRAYSELIGFWGSLMAGVDTRFGPILLDRIDKPLLVIAGDHDPLVTPAEARAIAAKSCCGRALIVGGAGHVESYKTLGRDRYIEEILDFVNSTGGR